MRAPIFEEELQEIYREAKRNALEEFAKTAVGEVARSFLIELKDKMKHKFKMIKAENEKIAEVSKVLLATRLNDEPKFAAFFMKSS
jgi:hypothetical protein